MDMGPFKKEKLFFHTFSRQICLLTLDQIGQVGVGVFKELLLFISLIFVTGSGHSQGGAGSIG